MSQPPTTNQPGYLDKGMDIIHQFVATIILHKKAVEFIREQKPWQGMDRLGWVLWVMAISAALISFQFFQEMFHTIKEVRDNQLPISAGLASTFSFEKIAWIAQGSRKYLIMIVLQLVVFYTIQKTLEIRIGRKPALTTKAFIDAQFRIISSTILAWVLETITRFLVVNLALGILGFHWLKQPTGFVIQCYFLGFAMIDNYHGCFGMKVSQSEKRTRKAAVGVAIAIGLVAQLLMHVPLIGAFAATMLGAVVATLAMERFAPVTEEEHLAFIAEQQRRKSKRPKDEHSGE
ncbi:MAG: hypothetical protein IPM82_02695 [Saprospiraceae bacterium]|nr:hypothetical protein [Saprospiraceae bacterium]